MGINRKNHISIICTALVIAAALAALSSCTRYEPVALEPGYDESMLTEAVAIDINVEEPGSGEDELSIEEARPADTRIPTRVKGVYLASNPLSNDSFVEAVLGYMDSTELNAVVIDIKDDYGRVTYNMQSVPVLDQFGTIDVVIDDMPELISNFKEHGVYTIARIVSMRDPYISAIMPEWCLMRPDGSLYTDSSGYTWVNPYKTDYWDYLLAIASQCAADGFDEIQFDYIRFCTDSGADDCVMDPDEVMGRDKISIITEVVSYLTEHLKPLGVYVSCDVFGTIIDSQIDSRAVGQDYAQLAAIVDYMSPMIYPSHYSSGNFGLDYPDKYPYQSILGALGRSRSELREAAEEAVDQAIVRPWLQAFTATWLGSGNYIIYDADAIRQEIQAVYDAGYDEWILWSASANYDYSVFLSEEEAAAEDERIAESRAADPPDTEETQAETFPPELAEALDGDDLYDADREILELDGPIITYE